MAQEGQKLKSTFRTRVLRVSYVPRRQIVTRSTDTAIETIMKAWWFEAPTPPPASSTPQRMMTGVGL